jgi:L-ascorbate metabolism protein UlaG (beta-lactamase superfamily)
MENLNASSLSEIKLKKIHRRNYILNNLLRGRLGESSIKIRWHGHACFEVGDGVSIITDPHDGKSIGIKPPHAKADIVLISHDHFDHNCLKGVEGKNTKVFSREIEVKQNGVEILGVKAYHDDSNGSKRGDVLLFKFSLEGVTFCHLGDLGHLLDNDILNRLGKIDILFIPVGDVFTIGPKNAWKVVNSIKPNVAIPMHYRVGGLSLSIKPVDPFLEDAKNDSIVKVGNEMDFEKDDLPEEFEVWVFTL